MASPHRRPAVHFAPAKGASGAALVFLVLAVAAAVLVLAVVSQLIQPT